MCRPDVECFLVDDTCDIDKESRVADVRVVSVRVGRYTATRYRCAQPSKILQTRRTVADESWWGITLLG
jgi:hypothetical protein